MDIATEVRPGANRYVSGENILRNLLAISLILKKFLLLLETPPLIFLKVTTKMNSHFLFIVTMEPLVMRMLQHSLQKSLLPI